MDELTAYLAGLARQEDSLGGLAMLALASVIEYVFPPFPGDLVVVASAVLITASGWSFFGVFGAVTAGSVIGAALAFELGLLAARRRRRKAAALLAEIAAGGTDTTVAPRRAAAREPPIIDLLVARFHRHGAQYLIVNRFVPGIRSFFFIAAGLAGMRRRTVLGYAAISAALYNLCLIALGAGLGANLEQLTAWVTTYSVISGAIVTTIVVVVVGGLLWRRRQARRARAALRAELGAELDPDLDQ